VATDVDRVPEEVRRMVLDPSPCVPHVRALIPKRDQQMQQHEARIGILSLAWLSIASSSDQAVSNCIVGTA